MHAIQSFGQSKPHWKETGCFLVRKFFWYLFQKIFGDVAQDLLFSYSVSQECNQYILAVLCPDKFFHFWQKYVRIAVLSCHS